MDDIKNFRQLNSKCPGHPEYRWTSGIETTTGPLGQGVATSVGMALASRWMREYFNRPGFEMVNFNVYALAGDGCMMEGVSGEAASVAGHLKLSNLCWIYDNNHITIEGNTSLAFSEDVATRFLGYGWNVLRVGDANDQDMVARAFRTFQATEDRPTIIIVDSHIAYGAPHKQDTSAAHGEPLGEEEIRLTKRNYGWPEDAKFLVPDGVYERFKERLGQRGRGARDAWMAKFAEYGKQFPELAGHLDKIQKRELPEGWDADIPVFPADPKGMAGRDASGKVENAIAKRLPWLIGGAADLAPSTKTRLTFEGAGDLEAAQLRRAQHAFRHPRACHGIDSERAFALEAAAVRLGFSDLQRLHARAHPVERADGDPGHLYLHARFDRRWRRRPHPPAGGATDFAAGHSGADRAAAGRRQ